MKISEERVGNLDCTKPLRTRAYIDFEPLF